MGVIHHTLQARPAPLPGAAQGHCGGGHWWIAAVVCSVGAGDRQQLVSQKQIRRSFLVTVEAPNGTSFAETDRALRFVEDSLRHMPDVKSWFANLGHGNPQVYYNVAAHADSLNYAEVFVQLKEYSTRHTPGRLDELRAQLARYPSAHIYVKEFVNGPAIAAPIAIRVIGPDLDVIDSLAGRVERIMTDTPGTRDVKNPLKVARTNLKLEIDSLKASRLGVPTVEFDRAVRLSVAGVPAGTFKDQSGEQYDIVVRTPIGARADLDALQEVRIPSAAGRCCLSRSLRHCSSRRLPRRLRGTTANAW